MFKLHTAHYAKSSSEFGNAPPPMSLTSQWHFGVDSCFRSCLCSVVLDYCFTLRGHSLYFVLQNCRSFRFALLRAGFGLCPHSAHYAISKKKRHGQSLKINRNKGNEICLKFCLDKISAISLIILSSRLSYLFLES